jgi:hypothetical protein
MPMEMRTGGPRRVVTIFDRSTHGVSETTKAIDFFLSVRFRQEGMLQTGIPVCNARLQ